MSYREPIEEIHRLGAGAAIGAVVLAEQTVDVYAAGFAHPDDRTVALDALLRDLARLRRRDPGLDGFITEIETYIDGLHRELTRRAA
jgi:hypothetical protein